MSSCSLLTMWMIVQLSTEVRRERESSFRPRSVESAKEGKFGVRFFARKRQREGVNRARARCAFIVTCEPRSP